MASGVDTPQIVHRYVNCTGTDPAPKHRIVNLESCHIPILDFDFAYELTEYDNTALSEVLDRVKDATIIITTLVPVMPDVLAQCPHLRLVIAYCTGIGWVDKEAYARHGVTAVNCPHSNLPAVSEHTLGLYIAVRKRIVDMHNRAVGSDEWAIKGTLTPHFEGGPPRTCAQETVGIIGYGAVGRKIATLMKNVGMGGVLIAERRHAGLIRDGRVAFDDVVRQSTVLIIACPKDASTIDLLHEAELRSMRKDAIVINMARGGIVNETALAKALEQRWIAGAATDVFDQEPPTRQGHPLLRDDGKAPPNLTVSPHNSWFAAQTISTLKQLLKDGVEAFVAGRPINVVAQPAAQN